MAAITLTYMVWEFIKIQKTTALCKGERLFLYVYRRGSAGCSQLTIYKNQTTIYCACTTAGGLGTGSVISGSRHAVKNIDDTITTAIIITNFAFLICSSPIHL